MEKESNLRNLIDWFIDDTKIEVTENEYNILLNYYKKQDEDVISNDFAYMHESELNYRNKVKEIRDNSIDSLVDWFINSARTKMDIEESDRSILSNYYKNNKYISEEKMVDDFVLMYKDEKYYRNKVDKIKNEIIKVEDLKDLDGLRYIKLIFGDGTEKVYESTLEENGSFMFDLYMKSGDNSRINATQFFLDTVQTKNELTKEEVDKLLPIDMEIKGGMSNQKRLGAHPGTGNSKLIWFEEGFMNLLFFIFLTGISTGIILMVVLNNLSK